MKFGLRKEHSGFFVHCNANSRMYNIDYEPEGTYMIKAKMLCEPEEEISVLNVGKRKK